MVRFRVWRLMFLLALLIGAGVVIAQNSEDEACATLVQAAIKLTADVCQEVEVGSICYGHDRIKAELTDGTFEKAGDIVPLDDIISLESSRGNLERDRWGIAVMSLADDLRLYMLGSTTLTNISDESGTSLIFSTENEKSDCNATSSKLILQSGADRAATITLNYTQITLNSASLMVVDAALDQPMNIMMVRGDAEITIGETSEQVQAGWMTSITLSENERNPTGEIFTSEEYDAGLLQFLPFSFFSDVIEIPALDRWTATGIELQAGDSYLIMAGELVKTIDYMPWSAPEGHSTSDCAAAGRGDWDCKCRTLPEWGECTQDEIASMQLMGRIGEDGEVFTVGAGGFFATDTDGELFLGPNDNTFTDNVGAYYAVIIVNDGDFAIATSEQ